MGTWASSPMKVRSGHNFFVLSFFSGVDTILLFTHPSPQISNGHSDQNVLVLTFKRCSAGITPLVVHGWNKAPLVGLWSESFCCVLSHMTVKPTHGIDITLKDCHTHIASTTQYINYCTPCHFCYNIKFHWSYKEWNLTISKYLFYIKL